MKQKTKENIKLVAVGLFWWFVIAAALVASSFFPVPFGI